MPTLPFEEGKEEVAAEEEAEERTAAIRRKRP
jgi:hypothetical protein